jgi:DELLA protein
VVTLAETEASLNSPYFLDRVQHAWEFYGVLFETLDATLPASSAERGQVEEGWYRAEIVNAVAFEGSQRFARHQLFSLWRRFFQGNGFENLAPSWRTVSQARYLLKFQYPADGYRVEENEGSVVLGWHDQPLFTVSSWKMAEMEEYDVSKSL